MDKIVSNVLKMIEDNGYEAYIVGGFVRDKLLGKETKDIDICTNALPKDLLNIFKNNIKVVEEYGAVKLLNGDYSMDITTFRKELEYKDNKPSSIEYIDDLYTDLLRRDFTINTLCYDSDENLIDLLDSQDDLNRGIIYSVGDVNIKFKEDATRMLRALRFMTVLNFKLDNSIYDYIKNNKESLKSISYDKRRNELDKIFASKYIYKFISIMKKLGLEEYLDIKVKKIVKTSTIIGMWAQIEVSDRYPFTRIEKKQIQDIKSLVNKGKIDKYDLYNYGSYICLNAGSILRKNTNRITKAYNKLPIKSIKEIDITSKEICDSLEISPSKIIGEILKTLEKEIIDGKLLNKKEILLKRILEWK